VIRTSTKTRIATHKVDGECFNRTRVIRTSTKTRIATSLTDFNTVFSGKV